MRSTIAGRAPGTSSGAFVFTWPAAVSEPAVAASAAARAARLRSDIFTSAIPPFLFAAEGIRNGDKDEESMPAGGGADACRDLSARRGADHHDRRIHARGQGQSSSLRPDDGGDQPLLRR